MGIHQATIEKLHNIVRGFRIGDIVTAKTVKAANSYVSYFVGRGYLVRVRRGVYRVLRPMTTQDIVGVIELYNLSQNKRRGGKSEKNPVVTTGGQRIRRTRTAIVDAAYDQVKDLRNGDRVLINSLTSSRVQRKRLIKTKVVRRNDPRSLIAGCSWHGEGITKEDFSAVLLGKRRPYKRRLFGAPPNSRPSPWSGTAKRSLRPIVDAGLEVLDKTIAPSKNGHADAPLTIESNGFRITLSKGSITISK